MLGLQQNVVQTGRGASFHLGTRQQPREKDRVEPLARLQTTHFDKPNQREGQEEEDKRRRTNMLPH